MTRAARSRAGRIGALIAGMATVLSVGCSPQAEELAQEGAPLPGLHNDAGIFALDPTYSILPDGSVTELASRNLGALRTRNGYFDAERQTIRLYGARNQEVAVQLVVPVRGRRFSARSEGLDGVPAERITFSTIGWSRITDAAGARAPFRPDVVVPLDGSVAGLRTFDVPLEVAGLPQAGNRQGLLLMEVWIPPMAAAGLHRGTVSVLEDGKERARLGVDLTVFPLHLPDRPTFRMDYLSYGSPLRHWGQDTVLGDGGAGDLETTPDAMRAEQQALALALDHRGFLNILPYASQRGMPFYAYPVQGVGRQARVVSFDGFDRRFGPLLDGRIGKFRTPPPLFTLPFNLNYPYTMRNDPAQQFAWEPFKSSLPDGPGRDPRLRELEETWRAVGQETLAHFAAKGWTRTAFEIYNNQKTNSNNRSPWSLDEPVTGPDFAALRYLFTLARWAFEGASARRVTIVTRVDIGHWECEGLRTPQGLATGCYKASAFNRANAQAVLQPVVDRWVVGHVHAHGAYDLVSRYNTPEVMFDEYSGSGVTAVHGGEFTGLAWIAHRLGPEGRMSYHAAYLDPTRVSGDGSLYNGRGLGFTGVLASRRVKLWRDAVNDYDLIALARRSSAAATRTLLEKVTRPRLSSDPSYRARSQTVETYVTNNVEDLLRARRLAAAIASRQPASVTVEGFSSRYTPAGEPDTITGFD